MVKVKGKFKLGCLIALIVVLLLIGGLIFGLSRAMKTVINTMQNTSYGKAAVKDLSSYVNVSGMVASSDATTVSTELTEKVRTVNVKVGDSVKKGDVLCELDSSYLQEQLDRLSKSADRAQDADDYHKTVLRRNLADAKSNRTAMLNRAQQEINKAERTRDQAYEEYNTRIDKYNQLLKEIVEAEPDQAKLLDMEAQGLSQENEALYAQLASLDAAVDAAHTAYDETQRSADQLVQTAQDALDAEAYTGGDDSTGLQIEKLQEQIDQCTVTAPADGVVTMVSVKEGSIPMGGMLMTIEKTDDLVISGKVGEADILRISEDMDCEIKTSATGDEIIPGKIRRIERIISSVSEGAAGGYTVEISIDDPDSQLLIGMTANVKIILKKVDNVLCVPYDAVQGGENDGYYVLTLEPGSSQGMMRVVRKNIEIGFEGDYYTEVKKGELKDGDIVLTATVNDMTGTMSLPEEGAEIPDPTLLGKMN